MDKIKLPGEWLDDGLTSTETAQVIEMAETIQRISEKYSDEAMEDVFPLMNSFMHFMYQIFKKKYSFKATSHGVVDKNGDVFDIVAFTLDFVINACRKNGINSSFSPEFSTFTDEINSVIPRLQSVVPLSSRFIPMLNSAASMDISQAAKRNFSFDEFTKTATAFTKSGNKLTIENFDKIESFGVSAKKIFHVAVSSLTQGNYYRSGRQGINPTVEIPLIEYGSACGFSLVPRIMPTEEEQKKENKAVEERIKMFKRDIRRDLRDLSSVLWSGEEKKGKNKGDYVDMRIISSHRINKGIITINFDIDAAYYLVNSYITQFPTTLLMHDNRKTNAYNIGVKLAIHNSIDRNVRIGTNCSLSVKKLLEASEEIPTIEDLKRRGQRNWKDKIKKPLESALEENKKVGYLERWEYRDPKTGTIYTPETAKELSWNAFYNLIVDYAVKDAPKRELKSKKGND